MDNDLVIFKDLPDKSTPLNAYNLNHNFDVFKAQNDKTAENLETTRQQLENNINDKNEQLENNITTKTNELNQNITKATEDLTNQITQAKTDLQTEIGEQIAKITTLQIEVVTELPTQDISKTTIYLIKPENLPQDLQVNSVQKSFTTNRLVISPIETNDLSAIAVTPEDFYLACFWVNNNWTIVGSTATDLTPYIKKTELASLETDPSVPNHVKSITQQNIINWNGKAEISDIPTKLVN